MQESISFREALRTVERRGLKLLAMNGPWRFFRHPRSKIAVFVVRLDGNSVGMDREDLENQLDEFETSIH